MNRSGNFQFSIFSFQLTLLVAVFLFSCQDKDLTQVKIERLEQSLFSIPVDSVAVSVPRLQQQYGELFDLYNWRVISIGGTDNPLYASRLTEFLTDSYMNSSYRKVTELYPDVKDIEKGLTQAFSNYRKAFPQREIPSVYTLISGFNQSIITADTILAIALDKYLGKDEEMYLRLNLATYQRNVMEKENIIPDCMRAWGETEFPYNDSVNNVLTNMLYHGKIVYYLHQMLPQAPESLLLGYTTGQMQWCEQNIRQMWTFLIEKKMLYATDYLTITKLIDPAPFCALFSRESPGRASVWLGYQIIRSYMKHNKVTLEALLLDDDYQQILAKAKFKP